MNSLNNKSTNPWGTKTMQKKRKEEKNNKRKSAEKKWRNKEK